MTPILTLTLVKGKVMGLKPWEVIKLLEQESSRLGKEDILRNNLSDGLKKGLKLAFDPFVVFGIKKLPKWSGLSVFENSDNNLHKEFITLCLSLSSRLVTGNAARDAVQSFCNKCTEDQWEYWFKRILAKDMKCGVQVSTWNKITDDPVFIFECQLALDSDKDKYTEILGMSDMYLEMKYDGSRCLSFVYPNGDVQLFSRNGKAFDNFPAIEKTLSHLKVEVPMMFDGEIMSEDFQALMKQLYRKDDIKTDDCTYYLFDCMTKEDFVNRKCDLTQKERKELLRTFTTELISSTNVVESPYVYIDKSDYKFVYSEFQKYVDMGLEGMMMKPAKGKYEFKRSKSYMKIKPFIDVTLTIVGFQRGEQGTKLENSLGALICEGVDKGRMIKVNCGGGLSDALRNQIWNNQGKALGQLVDIRADALSLAEGETIYSLRFPRFERFREVWDV